MSLTKASYSMITGAPANVLDYGAVGNGTTDDTAAINAALASAAQEVTFPVGTYLISSTINVTSKVKLNFQGGKGNTVGAYPSAYLIKKSTMTTAAVNITAANVIWIGGGVIGQTGNTNDGIVINANSVSLRDVTVYNMGRDGIRIGQDAAGGNSNSFILDGCRTYSNTRHGLNINDAPNLSSNANAGMVSSLFTQLNGGNGVYVNGAFWNTFINLLSEANTGWGIYLDQYAAGQSFYGGDVEANTAGQITTVINGTTNGYHLFDTIQGTAAISGTIVDNAIGTVFRNYVNTYQLEQQWTPTLSGTSTAGTNTYSSQFGYYERRGNAVRAFFNIILASNVVAMAGNLQISGLPYSNTLGNQAAGTVFNLVLNLTLPAGTTALTGALSNLNIVLYAYGSNTALTPIPVANINATSGRLSGYIEYLIA